MRQIFLKTQALLKEIPALKYIDLDYGQLQVSQGERPAVNFPCALINITYNNCDDLYGKTQRVRCTITVTLGVNISVDKTASIYPGSAVVDNLQYFDIVEAVYSKLQGYSDGQVEEFSRKNMQQELRVPGFKITLIPFETYFDEVG